MSIESFMSPEVLEILGWILVHFTWQACSVGILLYLTLNFLRHRSAQLRHKAAFVLLLSLLIFPITTAVWLLDGQKSTTSTQMITTLHDGKVEHPGASASSSTTQALSETKLTAGLDQQPRIEALRFPASHYAMQPRPVVAHSTRSIRLSRVLPFVVMGWLIGVAILALRCIVGLIMLHRLRSRATKPASQALQKRLTHVSAVLHVAQPIRLLVSRLVHVPVVAGWPSPVILIPNWVTRRFDLAKIEAIFAHELAHVHRNDGLVVFLQRLIETLFFFHPVVWWLSTVIDREREYSCDDIAVAILGNPLVYAQTLAELEAARVKEFQLALAVSSGSLLNRIRRLVTVSEVQNRMHTPVRAVLGSLVMTTLLVLGMLGVGSRIVLAEMSYQEAPALTEMVEQGALPPLEERLPAEPMVVPVHERIGAYGGTLRRAMIGINDVNQYGRFLFEGLVRWNDDWTDILPNLAHAWDVNEDATEYTFYLREGVRWSDGEPFTSADILFYFEDIIGNSELFPAGYPSWLIVDDTPVEVTAPDEYTVVFSFAAPYGFFLYRLATPDGRPMVSMPAHYAQQFHIDYNEQADDLARGEGFNTWVDVITNNVIQLAHSLGRNPDRPVLNAWRLTSPSDTRLVFERNPYYWKVDPEGHQLPYIDRMEVTIFEDGEVLLLNAMNGEIDWQIRHVNALSDRPVLVEYAERGDYQLFQGLPTSMNELVIAFNLNHQDPIKREIFNNRDFRVGLSHAINRQEIIDLVLIGQSEPWQAAPQAGSPFYHEQLATQYLEHDVDLANEYLDRAGYTERDSEGFRLGPDGNRISFAVETALAYRVTVVDILELVQMHWREVGIDMQVRAHERTFYETRRDANEYDAAAWGGDGGAGLEVLLEPRWYFPANHESLYAQAWQTWYNNPEGIGTQTSPEEPPADVRRQMELYDQIRATGDPDLHVELMQEILDIAADQFYAIGIAQQPPITGIVKNNLHNAPDSMLFTWLWMTPQPVNPEQFFIQD